MDRVQADDIKFWRTQQGNEIDFIVKDRVAYEVKYKLGSHTLAKYRKFTMQYPEIKVRFIYREGQASDAAGEKDLRF